MKKDRICDVCGCKFITGIKIKALKKGISPWNKRIFVCEKCENVMKLMILHYRKKREI